MDKLNIMDAIDGAASIVVPINSTRLGVYWVEISKAQATELIRWHDLQHMSVLDVNLYVSVQLEEQDGENYLRIG